MKHLLTILVAMTIASVNVFAQYAYEAQSNETEEISFDLNDYPEKIGKGVHMSDAGKTLLFTGASVALTGVACFIGGAAMYDPNPDAPDMPMYPLFAMAGAAAGGVIALIGLPFYFYGKALVSTKNL
jgi:hypothetical protein